MEGRQPLDSTRTERYWSRFPDSYEKNQEYVVGQDLLEQIGKTLDSLPALGEAVELGCGTGYFTQAIARKCESIVATDLSDTLLEMARRRFREHPEVSIQKENCMETTFPSEAFDSIFMANLIHVVEAPEKTLQESYRILRTGGTITIVSFTAYGMGLWERVKMAVRFSRAWGKPPSHAYSCSPERLTSMMADAGFSVKTMDLIGERTRALYAVAGKNSADVWQGSTP